MRRVIPTRPGTYSLVLACCWTAVMALSLVASITGLKREITAIAENIARAYIDKDILYRNWIAFHGGIYMPVGKGLVPNPLFPSSMPERDVVTRSGRHLTFVNPSYMMRKLYEFAQKEHKVSGRITSLKPLRLENKATPWEAEALRGFEAGKQEASKIEVEAGSRYLLLMRPLITEESCLACHAQQGYQKGDIRGGISIRFPLSVVESGMGKQFTLLAIGHGGVWSLGLIGLYAGYTGLRRRTKERDRALEELKRVNRILENQAGTDPVTGISNRRKFWELLQMQMSESRRYGMPLALIFFDVDHFKSINDNLGHEVGDSVLRELAHLVAGVVRSTDIFARFGGEEFVILVHDNDAVTGGKLAEKIRSCVSRYNFTEIGEVTCSFGVSQFHGDDTAETFIRRADEAMYAAKHAGRNRVEIHCDCERLS